MLEAKVQGDETQLNIFNGKQMAYKILANSLYGALGNEHFRFYNIDIAKSITLTGQELLKYCAVHCDEYLVKRGEIYDFKMNINFYDKVKSLTDVIYGDTDSIFIYLTDYLKDKGIKVEKCEEVFQELTNIETYVNDVVIDAFLPLHNISKDKSIIYLKNEYLFSKYYTLNGKKHYAAKVIWQEGKDVEFLEVKGLETRRSEIPTRSQKLLNEILEIIFDDNIKKYQIKDKVDTLVNATKIEMMKLIDNRDNSMVKTVSYSKPLNQYKNLPQHIKAMMIWNTLVGEDFRYGNKGKLWPIKGIDLQKANSTIKDNYYNKYLKKYNVNDLDCICLPEDVKVLPECFVPDMKRIMDYSCDQRVNNLLEPLWKESNQMLTF